jgi:cephalosporin hydroxylase
MDRHKEFQAEVKENIASLGRDRDLQEMSRNRITKVTSHKWAYNFSWCGRPAIQFPNDAWAVQELIWKIKPDLIIETGIAHGGSLIFNASMLALLDMADAAERGVMVDPKVSNRKVLGIDIDIREHNRAMIEAHAMSSRIQMIQGSSIAPEVIGQVNEIAKKYNCILICLDSSHSHDHVLAELEAYAPLTSVDSYCVVYDTIIDDMPVDIFQDRPWGPGDNPKTAVWKYLEDHPEFEIDKSIQHKLLITVAPEGFLKRVI